MTMTAAKSASWDKHCEDHNWHGDPAEQFCCFSAGWNEATAAHARRNSQTDEAIRRGVRTIKQRFTAWRIPPVELPAEHVIEQSVRDIIADVLRGEG